MGTRLPAFRVGGGLVLVIMEIVFVSAVGWLVLQRAERVGRRVGPVGLDVIVRLFGLVLDAIAVETMTNGLKRLFPVLSGQTLARSLRVSGLSGGVRRARSMVDQEMDG